MILHLSTTLLGLAALVLYWLTRRTDTSRPIDWRGLLARLPLPMLALAASYGVYSFARLFVPDVVAVIQAAAFELTYIGLAVTRTLDSAQRKRATLISVGAVVASIVYNTLAGWFHRQPELLSASNAYADLTWLMFAILHGAPLAWVAYLVADLLLHSQPKASRRPSQIRALVRRLARGWKAARAAIAPLEAMLAQARADLESTRALLAQQAGELAQAMIEAAQANADRQVAEQQAAQLGGEAAQLGAALRDVARLEAEAAQARAEAQTARAEQTQAQQAAAQHHADATRLAREQEQAQREYQQTAAQLRADLEIARAASSLDVLAVARRMVAAQVPLREIAPLLGIAESTLRGRLKAATNGHAIEV